VILTRVLPGPAESLDLDDPASRERLLELYSPPERAWVRLNLVASISGSAAGTDGTSETLTSPSDRRILGVIRELSDVVVVGAASVRAEGYRVPQRSRLAVVTASGDLSGHRLAPDDLSRVIVLCAASASGRARASLPGAKVITVVADGDRIASAAILAALAEVGLASVVCEGGPGLAAQFIQAGLVDELCLTTSPIVGDVRLPILSGVRLDDRHATLEHLLVDDASFVFARWSLNS